MPGSEIRDCAPSQSLYEAQLRQEAEEEPRPVPASCAPRLRKQQLGQWVRSRSMPRPTCQAFPGGAAPSGAEGEHAVSAAPLSAAEAEEQPPLGSAIQLQQAPPSLWLSACASGPGLRSLPYVPKQSPKQSSLIHVGRLPAQPRENLGRARGGLFHHQVERLFRSVWSCTIILSPSALFCRLSSLWELMPLVIRSGLLPSAQSEPLAAPAGAKLHSQSRSAPPQTPVAPRDRAVTFRTKSLPGPGRPKVLWPDQFRCL